MPKLILWEELWKEELVLLVKLLPEEQPLKGYKESSGIAAVMCSFYSIAAAQNSQRFISFVEHSFCDHRQEYNVRDKRKRELEFLEKV